MASLTTTDIRAYVADRQEKGYANATINRELSALKRMFTLAIQAGKLLQRPHIPMLAEDNVRQGFFERAQFEAVRNRLRADLSGGRDAGVLHRLAHQQRDPAARMAPDRPDGRRHSARARHDEEPRRPDVHVRRDSMNCRPRSRACGRATRRSRSEGILTPLVFCRRQGQRDPDVLEALEDGVRGRRLSRSDPA